jgi:hypothetical protein
MKADLGRKNRTRHACVVRLLSQIRKVPVEDSREVWKILALGSLADGEIERSHLPGLPRGAHPIRPRAVAAADMGGGRRN